MNLIVETDLGRDPDDFFAILWLLATGAYIPCITITPGHPDQIAVAQLIRKELKLHFTIGAAKWNEKKRSSGGMHYKLLEKYGYKLDDDSMKSYVPDAANSELLIADAVQEHKPELFIIGPATNVHKYLKTHSCPFIKATMQGGFCGYHIHRPQICIQNFEDATWQPTFNLNGDRPAGLAFIEADIPVKQFIGKNVCHTVLYDKYVHVRLKTRNRAAELFKEGMDIYLAEHEVKKFHDPAAAVVHKYPEVATWVKGKVQKIEQGWGTVVDDNGDSVAVDINYDQLWTHITEFI